MPACLFTQAGVETTVAASSGGHLRYRGLLRSPAGIPLSSPLVIDAVLVGPRHVYVEWDMRIDDVNEIDPFDARRGAVFGGRSEGIGHELLVREAVELACGRRHLTIVHGDPQDVAASRRLSGFYEELRSLAAECEWVRARGNAEYVTVTVGGAGADEQIALFEAAAAFADPGDWTIVASAVPPLS